MTDLYAICGTNRPNLAEKFTLNLLETSQCEIILIANPKIEIFNQLSAYKKSLPSDLGGRIKIYYSPYVTGFVQSVNLGWAKLREEIGNDQNILAFICADDFVFYPGWYETVLDCYKRSFPERDGLMFMRDINASARNQLRAGVAIVSAMFCDLYLGGWIAPPWYYTIGIDAEYAGVADKYRKCAACPDARCKHLMHGWEKEKRSEQHRLGSLIRDARAEHGWPYDIEAPWRHWK